MLGAHDNSVVTSGPRHPHQFSEKFTAMKKSTGEWGGEGDLLRKALSESTKILGDRRNSM